jgi:hypothetical protein
LLLVQIPTVKFIQLAAYGNYTTPTSAWMQRGLGSAMA